MTNQVSVLVLHRAEALQKRGIAHATTELLEFEKPTIGSSRVGSGGVGSSGIPFRLSDSCSLIVFTLFSFRE